MRREFSLVFIASIACSTVAPLPTPNECDVDADCNRDAGEVCAPDTRVCVPGSALPPRADLAFDIQEPQGFRVEISGCDCDVTQQSANNQLSIKRGEVEQTFELAIYAKPDVDQEMPGVGDVLPAKLQLTASTRFSAASTPTSIDYPTLGGDEENPQVLTTAARWPRYHPYDMLPAALANGGRVTWRSIPEELAPVYRLLRPPQTRANGPSDEPCELDADCKPMDPMKAENDPNFCFPGLGECTLIGDPHFAYRFQYNALCNRTLKGAVVRIDLETLEEVVDPMTMTSAIAESHIAFKHADIDSAPRLGEFALSAIEPGDRDPECDSDAQCVTPDEFCETTTHQCVLALAGRNADNGVVSTDANGAFSAQVYSYCEDEENDLAFHRGFSVTVAPPPTSAAPAVSFEFQVPFAPANGGTVPDTALPAKLCVPDWGPPSAVIVNLEGEPVTLLGSGPDAYECCDVSCLPATAEDAAMLTEPPQAKTCDGRIVGGDTPHAIVDAPFRLKASDLDAWEEAGCLRPTAGADDLVGGIRSDVISCNATEGTCVLPDLASGRDGGEREYGLRLESPVGSFLRSTIMKLAVGPDAATTPTKVQLDRRVLVRGRVTLEPTACDALAPADGDCGSEGAVVFAERVRMPGEDTDTVPGPYFHQVSTYYDPVAVQRGAFVLPLDPGVYLLTALPISGSQGGPAKISVLDLRDQMDRGDVDLVLESGVIVTLNLADKSFDRSSQVVPLDIASWAGLADPDGRVLDLNAPGECLAASTEGRCRIRRLTAGASITGSQVGQVRFIARRDGGASSCNVPMACPDR